MPELPPGHIEIHKGGQQYILWLTPEMPSLLRLYARQNNISTTDAGNRIILGFLAEHYGYESPAELRRRAFKALFPTSGVLKDAIISILKGEKPRRRLLPLRKIDKLPPFLTESGSTDHDNTLTS